MAYICSETACPFLLLGSEIITKSAPKLVCQVSMKHTENLGISTNSCGLDEPSRSATTLARVTSRGLRLSCCSLAYGEVQTRALPACLTAAGQLAKTEGQCLLSGVGAARREKLV